MKTKCMGKKYRFHSLKRNPANISSSESLKATLEKRLKTCSKLTRMTLERPH